MVTNVPHNIEQNQVAGCWLILCMARKQWGGYCCGAGGATTSAPALTFPRSFVTPPAQLLPRRPTTDERNPPCRPIVRFCIVAAVAKSATRYLYILNKIKEKTLAEIGDFCMKYGILPPFNLKHEHLGNCGPTHVVGGALHTV